tara:strand:- start:92 stop:790 length:699 start_codon:yes stop_codon:yes gene_type:complete
LKNGKFLDTFVSEFANASKDADIADGVSKGNVSKSIISLRHIVKVFKDESNKYRKDLREQKKCEKTRDYSNFNANDILNKLRDTVNELINLKSFLDSDESLISSPTIEHAYLLEISKQIVAVREAFLTIKKNKKNKKVNKSMETVEEQEGESEDELDLESVEDVIETTIPTKAKKSKSKKKVKQPKEELLESDDEIFDSEEEGNKNSTVPKKPKKKTKKKKKKSKSTSKKKA